MGRPQKPDGERIRDIAPTGVRLPPELRAALEREADINGRTLSAEIIRRLKLSLEVAHVSGEVRTGEPERPGAAGAQPSYQRPVTDHHRMLLALFDAMPPDKQLALLMVLKR
jgi:hypothetical protein